MTLSPFIPHFGCDHVYQFYIDLSSHSDGTYLNNSPHLHSVCQVQSYLVGLHTSEILQLFGSVRNTPGHNSLKVIK